jgi:hypothetical protein
MRSFVAIKKLRVKSARILIARSFLGLLCAGPMALPPIAANATEESISGRSYRAIQIAAAEFPASLDISRYRITVIDNASTSIVVIFVDADAPDNPHLRGNPGKIPGFEVGLARDNLRVVRSSFIR